MEFSLPVHSPVAAVARAYLGTVQEPIFLSRFPTRVALHCFPDSSRQLNRSQAATAVLLRLHYPFLVVSNGIRSAIQISLTSSSCIYAFKAFPCTQVSVDIDNIPGHSLKGFGTVSCH